MLRTHRSGITTALCLAGLLSRAAFTGRGQEGRSATLTITWDQAGRLVITGSGFAPRERIALTISVQSHSTHTSGSGPGTISQSSQSSSQNLGTAVVADANGHFRHELLIRTAGTAELRVTATGDQGSTTQSRLTARRPS